MTPIGKFKLAGLLRTVYGFETPYMVVMQFGFHNVERFLTLFAKPYLMKGPASERAKNCTLGYQLSERCSQRESLSMGF